MQATCKLIKKLWCNHNYLLILAAIVSICSCSVFHSKIDVAHQLSFTPKELVTNVGYTPIAVFPLQNATGKSELDWLSLGLQEEFTQDLRYVSELNTKELSDLNMIIKKYCHNMTLSCLVGVNANRNGPLRPLELSNWQEVAADVKLRYFLWGNYRLYGEDIIVNLHLYAGQRWTSQDVMTIKAPLSELLEESSQQILRFLLAQGIAIKPEERERILTSKTESVTAWKLNVMGYWWHQMYLVVGEDQKNTIAEKCKASLEEAIEIDPDYAEAWCNLGYHKVTTGDLDGATEAFRKALERKPEMVKARLGLGYSLAEGGDLTNAISQLKQGIKLNPSLSDHYGYLMNTYRKATLWEEGLKMLNILERFLKEHNREAERIEVVWWQALFLQELKQLARSQKAYHEVLSFKEAHLGSEHPEIATVLNNLALLYKSMGQYGKARPFYERALAIDEKIYGREHFQVSTRLNNLALLYHVLGEYDKAKPLYERALAIDKKTYGEEHPDVAKDLNNLAELSYATAHYSRAKPLYERAIIIYQKVLGQKHPDVATVLNNLAMLYHATGQYHQAKPLYEQALAIDEKFYGEEHPDVAKDLNNLAGFYYAIGQYHQAKPLYEQALAIDEKFYGEEHPDVAKDLNNLAEIYRILGKYDKAKSLYERAFAIYKNVLSPDHTNVAILLNNLAELYGDLGEYDKAEPLFLQALSIYKKAYGPQHPDVATVFNNLAGLYYALRKYEKATLLYEQALAIDKKVYGEEHPSVSIRLNNLAELYYAKGQYDKAQHFYERALAVAQISGKPELIWRIQFNLGFLLAKQHNPQAAIFFSKQAVNTIQGLREGTTSMERDLKKSFLKTKWHAYRFLADLLIDQERIAEAQQVLDMQKEEEYFDFICRDATKGDVRTTTATYLDEEYYWSERFREMSERIAALGEELTALKQKKNLGLTDEEKKRYRQLSNDLKTAQRVFDNYLAELIDTLSGGTRERYAKLFLDSCGVTKWLKAASILDRYLKNAKKVVPQNIHLFLDL